MKSIFLITIALLLAGCHPLFCAWNMGFDDKQVSKTDAIGEYLLISKSKKMMEYEGGYKDIPNSVIKIKADSTCVIENAPDWLFNSFGVSNRRYISTEGTWIFTCDKVFCDLELDNRVSSFSADMRFKQGKLYLLIWVGDPDSCQGIIYEKIH